MAYTWAKAMATSGTNPFVPAKIWNCGPTTDDHTFVGNFVWDLPSAGRRMGGNSIARVALDGWQFSGIYTFTSGTPRGITITTTDGYDFSGGDAGVRPDIVGRAAVDSPAFDRWFDPASVALPARGTFGNAAVTGSFNGPGINNFDLTLAKGFAIAERHSLRLRLEAYNAFNHTQYDGVDTTARFTPAGAQINTLLGQVTSARAPRVIQLGLSYSF